MMRSNAPKAKAKPKPKAKAKAKAPKPKPSAHRHREEVGGSERTKRQRKGVARWLEDPLSSLNLGGSRYNFFNIMYLRYISKA